MASMLKARCDKKEEGPVSLLPPETLGTIFVFAVKNEEKTYNYTRRSAPINISSVSKRWRSVAINFPLLWNSISATASFSLEERKDPRRLINVGRHIPLFLKRSGPVLPISLSFAVLFDDNEDPPLEGDWVTFWVFKVASYLAKFDDHFQRLENVDVAFRIPMADLAPLEYCLNAFIARLKWLKTIKLVVGRVESDANPSPIKLNISHNSVLKSASVENSSMIVSNEGTVLNGITQLYLSIDDPIPNLDDTRRMFGTLGRMPNLAVLHFVDLPWTKLRYEGPLIVLPSLKALIVDTESDGDDLSHILQPLVCPSLEQLLFLSGNGYPSNGPPTFFGLPSFIQRSRCNLKTLLLNCTVLTEDELFDTLREVPDLERLMVHNSLGNGGVCIFGPEGRRGQLPDEFYQNGGRGGVFTDGSRVPEFKSLRVPLLVQNDFPDACQLSSYGQPIPPHDHARIVGRKEGRSSSALWTKAEVRSFGEFSSLVSIMLDYCD